MLPNTISQDRGKDWTSLHEAAANGNEEMIKTLLAGNSDTAAKEAKLGNTPLHEVASRGFSRSVKLLCTPKVTTKSTSKSKQKNEPPKPNRGTVQNPMLSIQNFAGFTALHLAAQNGHNQSCRELLLAGANPDVENYYGDTALHTACRYGHAGAARILISAFCDVNKKNLNGDTPLHITSAMGRHKLSRILLEAECEINSRNSQCETPRDIAIRKGFGKILDILDNPHRIRNKKSKPPAGEEDKTKAGPCTAKSHSNEVSWSPYGCHYFPDMRAFPSPKLETLPKEPLKRGEQYYLDLAGHIRKGPIGIGNICYCGPFFKHIEDKINSNKRHLRKYVHNAKEHLDDKVQALAARTNHQIEKLTRTMIADRVECENRRIYLENYLKRGDPLRLTTDVISKGKEAREMLDTLKRCRSLEFLEKVDMLEGKMANSRSFDLLDANANEATGLLHRDEVKCCPHSTDMQNQLSEDSNNEFYDVSKRLGSLLAKTSTFLKVPAHNEQDYEQSPEKLKTPALDIDTGDGALCARVQNMHLSPSNSEASNVTPAQMSSETGVVSSPDYNCNFQLTHAAAKRKAIAAMPEEETTASSTASPLDRQHRDKPITERQLEYLYDIQKRGSVIQNVISALRKSHQRADTLADVKTRNESEYTQEDKLRYKDELFQVHRLAESDSKEEAMLKEIGLPLENTIGREPHNLVKTSAFELKNRDYTDIPNLQTQRGRLTTPAYIKQGTPVTHYQNSSYTESHPGEECLDSLEIVQQQPQLESAHDSPVYAQQIFEGKPAVARGSTPSHATDSPDSQNYVFQTNYWPERYVPKDAYFHDLSQRKCRMAPPSAVQTTTTVDEISGYTNALPKFNVANAVKSIENLNGQVQANTYIRDPTVRSSINSKSHLVPVAIKTSQSLVPGRVHSSQSGCAECTDAVCSENCAYSEQVGTVRGAQAQQMNHVEGQRVSHATEAGTFGMTTQPSGLSETGIVTKAAVHNGGHYGYSRDETGALGAKTRLPATGYYASNVSSLV
ncbi:ankyrin repeat domain-containing protein 11 [Anastrepha obliqua]|uniref:ankyrin repeat domain-containing protein 11 n=1 Tax=Anastrepha obliqua TaxID=95512 RepID=UPI0024093843|nr:ankyrin repeat domain-containing protein 11 [Anastrepha obliqua]